MKAGEIPFGWEIEFAVNPYMVKVEQTETLKRFHNRGRYPNRAGAKRVPHFVRIVRETPYNERDYLQAFGDSTQREGNS